MSEYQYYEFRAIDRPLTRRQMEELRRLSSRAEITSTRFVTVYHHGDFRGDPGTLLRSRFDAFVYVAMWGTHQLMLRLPVRLLAASTARMFAAGRCLEVSEADTDVVVSLRSNDPEAIWEGSEEEWLPAMLPVREALMAGDLRALYLGWLLGVQSGEVREDALEPPVPPGLGDLDAPLETLVEFLRLDPELVAAAAESSLPARSYVPAREQVRAWVEALPAGERDALLVSFVTGDDLYLAAELRQKVLRSFLGERSLEPGVRRTAAELTSREVRIIRGIFQQMHWYLDVGHEKDERPCP